MLSSPNVSWNCIALMTLCCFSVAAGTRIASRWTMKSASAQKYSIPNQPLRFKIGKEEKNERMLSIDTVYKPGFLKGKTALVTGGNRGIGLALTKELVAQGAKVYITSRSKVEIDKVSVIDGIDVTDNACGTKLLDALKAQTDHVDILINNAGYFYEPIETLNSLNFEEEMKMIDICALGPLRISSALYNNGFLKEGSKVAIISSQGGSIEWRDTQNPTGIFDRYKV